MVVYMLQQLKTHKMNYLVQDLEFGIFSKGGEAFWAMKDTTLVYGFMRSGISKHIGALSCMVARLSFCERIKDPQYDNFHLLALRTWCCDFNVRLMFLVLMVRHR